MIPPHWSELNTMTIAFGQGLNVAPLQAMMAVGALANGGYHDQADLPQARQADDRARREPARRSARKCRKRCATSCGSTPRSGSAKKVDIPGYFAGGKTGTADKIIHGHYSKDRVFTTFMSIVPADKPKYLFFVHDGRPAGRRRHLRLPHGRLELGRGLRQDHGARRAAPEPAAEPRPADRSPSRPWPSSGSAWTPSCDEAGRAAATAPASKRRLARRRGRGPHGRQPRRAARLRVLRRAGQPGATGWPSLPRPAPRGAVAVVAERRRAIARCVLRRPERPRWPWRAAAARFYPRQPATDRGRDGHQRQDLGRGLRAADLGRRRRTGRPRSARSASWRRTGAIYGSLTTPDPVTLHRDPRPAGRATASRISRSKPRRTGSTSTGSTASGSPPAPSPTCRATISTTTPRSTPISPPSCGCSTSCSRPGQPAVIDADGEAAGRVIGGRGRRAASRVVHGRAGRATASPPAVGRAATASRPGCALAPRRAGPRRSTCRWPAASRSPNALVAAGLCIATGTAPEAVFAALERLVGAPGRLERVGERDGAPIFVDYAHKPDALDKVLRTLRPYAARPPRRGVRLRRRPRRRQAAPHGRDRQPASPTS